MVPASTGPHVTRPGPPARARDGDECRGRLVPKRGRRLLLPPSALQRAAPAGSGAALYIVHVRPCTLLGSREASRPSSACPSSPTPRGPCPSSLPWPCSRAERGSTCVVSARGACPSSRHVRSLSRAFSLPLCLCLCLSPSLSLSLYLSLSLSLFLPLSPREREGRVSARSLRQAAVTGAGGAHGSRPWTLGGARPEPRCTRFTASSPCGSGTPGREPPRVRGGAALAALAARLRRQPAPAAIRMIQGAQAP